MKKYDEYIEKIKQYENLLLTNKLSINLFETDELNENDSERKLVIELIKKGSFDSDSKDFLISLKKSNHIKMLTVYSISELNKMKIFKLKGYDIGFALKLKNGKYSEIVCVHNNEQNIKAVGDELIKYAIKMGGCYLDHFDGHLTDFYQKLGFVEYDRDSYNPIYDKNGEFKKKYGEQDVIYRIYKGCKK